MWWLYFTPELSFYKGQFIEAKRGLLQICCKVEQIAFSIRRRIQLWLSIETETKSASKMVTDIPDISSFIPAKFGGSYQDLLKKTAFVDKVEIRECVFLKSFLTRGPSQREERRQVHLV